VTAMTRLSRTMPNDLRSMLTEAKIGQYQAAMAIQYMNFLPETCDLYAQGVILIIQGLQNLLNDRGASLEADGDFNVETMGALEHFAGPNWHSKSWTQLYGDVIAGKPYGGKFRRARGVALGFDGDIGLLPKVYEYPLLLALGGAFVWWKWFRK